MVGMVARLRFVLSCLLVASLAGCGGGSRAAVPQGTFAPTGSMTATRWWHTATLLPDGKVLIAGGREGSVGDAGELASAELYDPIAGTFTATSNMAVARVAHTATLLPNGEVLIAGGEGAGYQTFAREELYDPSAGTFTAIGSMTVTRGGPSATLLPSGKVLIAGGADYVGHATLASAELYDPAAGTFTATGSMTVARQYHTATLLGNGIVLIAGGGDPSAELYDPVAGTFTGTGSMTVTWMSQTTTLLPNGKVLITGGLADSMPPAALAWAEVYDLSAGTFTATGSMTVARIAHTATLLGNGMVLVAGGGGSSGGLASAELYDPAAGTFTAAGNMTAARWEHTATLLPSGKVLIAGGIGSGGESLASVELYGNSPDGGFQP